MSIDSIATRDIGFVPNRSARHNGSSNALTRSETVQSIVSDSVKTASQSQNLSSSQSSKRAVSPEHAHRRRDESRDYPAKRARPSSPNRSRGERDRWEGAPHRRHGSPGWEREREPPPLPSEESPRELPADRPELRPPKPRELVP